MLILWFCTRLLGVIGLFPVIVSNRVLLCMLRKNAEVVDLELSLFKISLLEVVIKYIIMNFLLKVKYEIVLFN